MKLNRVLTAAILAVSILIGTAVPAIASTNADARHFADQALHACYRISATPSLATLACEAVSDHLTAKTPSDRHQTTLTVNQSNEVQLQRLAAIRSLLATQVRAQVEAQAQSLSTQHRAASEQLAAKVKAIAVTRTRVVSLAKQYLGVPYVWAGSSPRGFDCSGFVLYVYKKLGVNLPHLAASQYNCGRQVNRSQLQPGDLVFFYRPIHHVGIYIGNGLMINARGAKVQIEPLWNTYAGATRLIS